MIKIGLLGIIVVCWYLGGQWRGKIRDIPVPILLGIGIWLATKSWFVGLVSIGLWQIIRLGYGNYEKSEKNSFLGNLTKDKQGAVVRALYGLIVALVGSGALLWAKYLPLPKAIVYVGGNTLIGYSVSRFRLPVLITDILMSIGFGSILFLI